MASPNKRKGKKLYGSFGKARKAQSESPVEPVVEPAVEPAVESPAPDKTIEPIKKKRSFFSKDKE